MMLSNLSLAKYLEKVGRFFADAALVSGENPWFVAVDKLRAKIEAEGGTLTSFAHYDYLGLAGHPAVTAAAQKAILNYGTGVMGSRLVGGERTFNAAFEDALARFVGTEAALTLVSGYLTNFCLIPHLLAPRDLLIVDEFAHNSIMAGAWSTRAESIQFRHNDLDHLESVLRSKRAQARNCLIAIEGLYSMDGDIPDLPQLLKLKEKYGAWLLIDEAHSIGLLGAGGRGITEHFREDPTRIDLIVGTLSKSFVSCGGFICARKDVILYLKYTLGGFVYSVGVSPVIVAAAHAALDLLISEPERVAATHRVSNSFLMKAREAGLDTGSAIGRGIVPIIFKNMEGTMRASEALLQANIYAPPIVQIGVPKNQPRIRFFLSAKHDGDPAITRAVDILARETLNTRSDLPRGSEDRMAIEHKQAIS